MPAAWQGVPVQTGSVVFDLASAPHGPWGSGERQTCGTHVLCDSLSAELIVAEIGREDAERKLPIAKINTDLLCNTTLPFGEWGGPREVVQASMSQENMTNRHTVLLVM